MSLVVLAAWWSLGAHAAAEVVVSVDRPCVVVVNFAPYPTTGGQDVVVRIPHGDEVEEQVEIAASTAALLARIARLPMPFERPLTLALIDIPDGVASVQTRLFGGPLWKLVGHKKTGEIVHPEPWRPVGEAAAAIHAVPRALATGLNVSFDTRRAHAESMAEPAAYAEAPYMDEVEDWLADNLPPATPSHLLHGDLLGQNVLWSPGQTRVSVIDWEAARLGDPAYDMAIITRGRRKPFGRTEGLRWLLDAYNASSPVELSDREVRFHELSLMAAWIADSEGESANADYKRRGASLWKRVQALG
ncbi:MAG: aminoglycoside phosphotransferase family protein [Myxococcales bacterium]|nr:aminoglycoside phosphotransferase family protein [Myxococcales bacterium]